QRDIVEDDLVPVRLADGAQAVNELGHVSLPTYCRRRLTRDARLCQWESLGQWESREGGGVAPGVTEPSFKVSRPVRRSHLPAYVPADACGPSGRWVRLARPGPCSGSAATRLTW